MANALITLTHRSTTQYQRWDYCFYNGKLYRALVNTTGAFAPGDWREVVLGDDVSVLTRLINALDTDNIDNASTVSGTTASDALNNLQTALGNLDSDDIDNASQVTGTSITDALDNLNGAINDEATARQNADTAIQNKLNVIGTILEAPASPVTVASGAVVEITSITLPIGNWIIFGSFIYTVSFSQAANGYLMIGSDEILTTRGTGINGGTFAPLVTSIANANNTTVTMKTYQESGSEKTASPYYFRAIRIS